MEISILWKQESAFIKNAIFSRGFVYESESLFSLVSLDELFPICLKNIGTFLPEYHI